MLFRSFEENLNRLHTFCRGKKKKYAESIRLFTFTFMPRWKNQDNCLKIYLSPDQRLLLYLKNSLIQNRINK